MLINVAVKYSSLLYILLLIGLKYVLLECVHIIIYK